MKMFYPTQKYKMLEVYT